MKKKVAVILSILGCLLIILGIVITNYTGINKKNNELKDKQNTILKDYNVITEKNDSFNSFRSGNYYNNVAKDLIYLPVEENYNKWITTIDEYTALVDELEKSSKNLKELCINEKYSNKEVDNACKSFIIKYETTINYYTKDIMAFNNIIEQYYRINLLPSNDIKPYPLKYNFTDINTDGNFVGKD